MLRLLKYGFIEDYAEARYFNTPDHLNETYDATAKGAGLCVGHPFPGVSLKIIAIDEQPIPTLSQAREFGVDVVDDLRPQALQIDAAGPQHRHRIAIFDHGKEKVLQSGVLVPALVGVRQSSVKGLFQIGGKHA